MYATLRSTALAALFALALPAAPLAAQQSLPTGCDGNENIVRVSDVKPGMMDKFVEAVAAQKAWYKKAGTSDEIILLKVLDTKDGTWSTTEALTEHIGGGTRPAHDAGYQAFVDLFTASSTIRSQYVTCRVQ